MMTFDNADELHKIKRYSPNAKLVLRMLTDDSKSLCRLGLKFGAPLSTCPGLLSLARNLGLNVIGVSFHVGSGCKDPMQFADAVWRARKVFDMGKEAGYEFKFLDVGGGFERETFQEMSEVVKSSLDLYFPEEQGVRVVAEPGRFLVSSGESLPSLPFLLLPPLLSNILVWDYSLSLSAILTNSIHTRYQHYRPASRPRWISPSQRRGRGRR